jgi:hypothetical protein
MAAGLCRPWQPLPWRLKLALPAQVRLELGEHAQHVQQALAGGRAGVDPLLQYRAARRDSANDVLKVSDASGEAIDAGDHQDVAERIPSLGRGAAPLLCPDDLAASRLQRRFLDREVRRAKLRRPLCQEALSGKKSATTASSRDRLSPTKL